MSTRRVVVFNATRGHRKPLFGQLRALGVKTSVGYIPPDLAIVQIGDLIGAYPNSSEDLIREVQNLRQHSPGQWIQLMGKAEAGYHPAGLHYRPAAQLEGGHRDIQRRHQTTIKQWWVDRECAGVAAVIASDTMAPTLITHSGVHKAVHNHFNTNDPYAVAAHLNEQAFRCTPWIFGSGHAHEHYDTAPGPIWATPFELWASWATQPLPYDQIVGGFRPYHFTKKRWWARPADIDTTHATVLEDRRMTYWRHPHSPHGIAHIDDALQAQSPPSQLKAHTFQNAVVEVP